MPFTRSTRQPINKRLLILGSFLIITLAFGVILVSLFINSASPLVKVADDFLALSASQQLDQAYALTAPGFRKEVSKESFPLFLKQKQLDAYASHVWNSRQTSSTSGRLAGSFTTRSERSLPLTFYLEKTANTWQIVFISHEPDTPD